MPPKYIREMIIKQNIEHNEWSFSKVCEVYLSLSQKFSMNLAIVYSHMVYFFGYPNKIRSPSEANQFVKGISKRAHHWS